MNRSASILVTMFVVGCASAPTQERQFGEALPWRSAEAIAEGDAAPTASAFEVASSSPSVVALEPEALVLAEPISRAEPLYANPSAAQDADRLHTSRFTLKAGYYSAEDADELDSGTIVNASWMRFYSKILALEMELGYFGADGDDGGFEAEVWGVPFMANLRANVPIWVLDVYGGLGIGTIYYDVEVDVGPVTAESDGFVVAGNAFLGATINLADKVALGLEAKYYVSEDVDNLDTALDAFALMLTLGFGR